MILKVFAVHDTKAKAFLQPFYSPSAGSALRAFGDAVNEKQCPFNKHPSDYMLYEIGSYDDSTASLDPLEVVKLMGCASDFIDLAPKENEMPQLVAIENGKK